MGPRSRAASIPRAIARPRKTRVEPATIIKSREVIWGGRIMGGSGALLAWTASLDNDKKRKISREGVRASPQALNWLHRPAARAASTAIADSVVRTMVKATDRQASAHRKVKL
jgi:hypothetical protein